MPEYFCDREQEQRRLVDYIENGSNLVLLSPRRMGKTGLVQFCYEHSSLSEDYYTFFIDILHTSNLREFTYQFGRKVSETLQTRSRKMLMLFAQTLRSIVGQFGIDPLHGTPTFNLEIGGIERPEITLEEIFSMLEHADKPCVVCFDEFQQVARYQEKNIEALLRSHIQGLSNVHFIFAGSEQHIMQEMFQSTAKPFYHSASLMELKAIPLEVYTVFVQRLMQGGLRKVDADIVQCVYQLFGGNTFAMQKIFNEIYKIMDEGESCSPDLLITAIKNVLEESDSFFRVLLADIPERYKPTLYAIAQDGEVTQVTATHFIKSHKLTSASATQYAVRQLLNRNVLARKNGAYSIAEPFMALWLNQLYGRTSIEMMVSDAIAHS